MTSMTMRSSAHWTSAAAAAVEVGGVVGSNPAATRTDVPISAEEVKFSKRSRIGTTDIPVALEAKYTHEQRHILFR
jgi:hypothetical protein